MCNIIVSRILFLNSGNRGADCGAQNVLASLCERVSMPPMKCDERLYMKKLYIKTHETISLYYPFPSKQRSQPFRIIIGKSYVITKNLVCLSCDVVLVLERI